MSTLTKVLVVLVSLLSIFLCGTVVTYVANSSNYKALYQDEQNMRKDAEAERASAISHYNTQLAVVDDLKRDFNERIAAIEEEKSNLVSELRSAQRAGAKYLARADSWQGIVTGFEQTIGNMEQSLKLAQGELDNLRTDRADEKKEFNQITSRLYETLVQMETLSADKRRLQEEISGLEEDVSNLAGAGGARAGGRDNIVTPEKSSVTAVSDVGGADISGLITEVGESLVSISIGSADGVKKNMVFHVTRGDEFICDVVVTDVDTNKAAGVLELRLQDPRMGDTISTNL